MAEQLDQAAQIGIARQTVNRGQDLLPLLKHLENSADDAHNLRSGALGTYQIMPGVGRSFGVKNPADLLDPEVNKGVATSLANDLFERYHGNVRDVLVAWNAGTRRANRWIASGRTDPLPAETRHYLANAATYISNGVKQMMPALDESGDPREPPL